MPVLLSLILALGRLQLVLLIPLLAYRFPEARVWTQIGVADPPVASADGIVKIWFLDLELASLLVDFHFHSSSFK